MISTTAVLGPGAVGGFLAALLWEDGRDVSCIATERGARMIASNGIRVESSGLGEWVARPSATPRLSHPVDVLFVTTKAPFLEEALARVDPALLADGMVVPLLNGLGHYEPLRRRFGDRVVAATIGQVQVVRRTPTHIIHTTTAARIEMASDGAVGARRIDAVVEMLRRAGVSAERLSSEAAVTWRKLVRLNALACTTAAADRPLGEIRSDPFWRARLERCVREGAAVANAQGYASDSKEVLEAIAALPPDLGTSLQRDVVAERPSELDSIAGEVVRAGARAGLGCPTIEELIEAIEARARNEPLRADTAERR